MHPVRVLGVCVRESELIVNFLSQSFLAPLQGGRTADPKKEGGIFSVGGTISALGGLSSSSSSSSFGWGREAEEKLKLRHNLFPLDRGDS